jgi:transposase, ISlxx5
LLLRPLPLSHDADTVVETLTDMIAGLPQDLRRTLTWEQGAEIAKTKELTKKTTINVYFADPHSPWQRGSNKNINGLLRDYFPKSTDLGTYPPEDLRRSPTPTQHPTPPTIQLKTPAKPIEQLPHNDAVALTT